MNKVICIVGPTASGKSSLGISLAKEINGEIISADSMQIYKGLDIGSGKVTKSEMDGVKHHMIDICSVNENFSAFDYKILCYNKIEEIIKKGKTPIIVGGTGLYISSVVLNYGFIENKVDSKYREELYELANKFGNEYLHNMLKELDFESSEEIHFNNTKRVVRALEMIKLNVTKSKHIETENLRKNSLDNNYKFEVFCLKIGKDILDEKINKRVDFMMDNGLENEAKEVYKVEECTAKQAIGYKEFFKYFEKRKTLEEVVEEIKLRTRQYAKRQITWFKKIPNVVFLDGLFTKEKLIEEIKRKIYEK